MDQTQLTQVIDEDGMTQSPIVEDYGDAWALLEGISHDVSTHKLVEDEITIGRSESCNIVIPDRKISSVHCKITRSLTETQGNNVYLQDLRFYSFPLLLSFVLYHQYKWNFCEQATCR